MVDHIYTAGATMELNPVGSTTVAMDSFAAAKGMAIWAMEGVTILTRRRGIGTLVKHDAGTQFLRGVKAMASQRASPSLACEYDGTESK